MYSKKMIRFQKNKDYKPVMMSELEQNIMSLIEQNYSKVIYPDFINKELMFKHLKDRIVYYLALELTSKIYEHGIDKLPTNINIDSSKIAIPFSSVDYIASDIDEFGGKDSIIGCNTFNTLQLPPTFIEYIKPKLHYFQKLHKGKFIAKLEDGLMEKIIKNEEMQDLDIVDLLSSEDSPKDFINQLAINLPEGYNIYFPLDSLIEKIENLVFENYPQSKKYPIWVDKYQFWCDMRRKVLVDLHNKLSKNIMLKEVDIDREIFAFRFTCLDKKDQCDFDYEVKTHKLVLPKKFVRLLEELVKNNTNIDLKKLLFIKDYTLERIDY